MGQAKHAAVSSSWGVLVQFDGSCAHLPLLLQDCYGIRASVYVVKIQRDRLVFQVKKTSTIQNGACRAGS